MNIIKISQRRYQWFFGIVLFAIIIGLVSLFSSGLARWLVDRNFPPVDIAELKQSSAADAAQALDAIDQPTVLVSLSAATLSKSLTDAVDAALAGLGARDAGEFGRVRIVEHRILATPEDVQVRLAGDMTVELVDYATIVTADVDLRVFSGFAGEAIVYRPALAGLKIRSITSSKGWATTFRLAELTNAAISIALDNINGAINQQRLAIDALGSLRGHLATDNSIEIAGRKVIILPPILKAASVLVTPQGLAVLAEVAPEQPPVSRPARSGVTNLTQAFVAKATSAFPDYLPGRDGAWVDPTALHRLVLADRYQPAQKAHPRGIAR